MESAYGQPLFRTLSRSQARSKDQAALCSSTLQMCRAVKLEESQNFTDSDDISNINGLISLNEFTMNVTCVKHPRPLRFVFFGQEPEAVALLVNLAADEVDAGCNSHLSGSISQFDRVKTV